MVSRVESFMGSTILRTRIRLRTPYWPGGEGVHPYPYAFAQVNGRTPGSLEVVLKWAAESSAEQWPDAASAGSCAVQDCCTSLSKGVRVGNLEGPTRLPRS